MKLTGRLELFAMAVTEVKTQSASAMAVAICPEIKYELDGMKRFYIDKTKFGEGLIGEEIDIRKTAGEIKKYAPYVASININGIEFFTYLNEEDIDEESKEFI